MFSILVVEDNENLNKMMSAKLKMETYNVFSAFNGEEALEVLEHEHIDLIISDVMMPGIDGYELTKTLIESLIIFYGIIIEANKSHK